MFKKNFPLIFITTIFLSFDKQTKAMQESDLGSTSEATIQQDIFHCGQEICRILSTTYFEIIKDIPCHSLKFLAASKFLEILKTQGYSVSTENLQKIALPEDLIEYCKLCYLIPLIPIINLIHQHIASLEQFKKHKYLKMTDQNLNSYKTLLHNLIFKIDLQNINIQKILSAFNENFKSEIKKYERSRPHCEYCKNSRKLFYHPFHIHLAQIVTLEDINMVLKLLIQSEDTTCSDHKIKCYIWDMIFSKNLIDLFKLIATNKKLLPRLEERIPYDFTGDTIIIFLLRWPNEVDLFRSIINEEKKKNYNWKRLFNMRFGLKRLSILHYAANGSTNNLEVILELMKEKELKLDNFINAKTDNGRTALMYAAYYGSDENVQLLINHGANINISTNGEKALHYAIKSKEKLLRKGDIDPETLEKLNRCIELLTPEKNCIMQ